MSTNEPQILKDSKSPTNGQPWIYGPFFDQAFILWPGIVLATALVLMISPNDISFDGHFMIWVVCVLLVDVTHVYSTIFRTYANSINRNIFKSELLWTPIVALAIGVMLYSLSDLLFWRILAYVAVYHFVRQQYGFLALYRFRLETVSPWNARIDKFAIYTATLTPIAFWHAHLPREFHWFIDDDFVAGLPIAAFYIIAVGFVLSMVFYLGKEIQFWKLHHKTSWPQHLILFSTIVTWWIGIIYFNNDIGFTILNTLSHGIPYMALVWATQQKQRQKQDQSQRSLQSEQAHSGALFQTLKPSDLVESPPFSTRLLAKANENSFYGVLVFLTVLIVLAYCEEYLWAGLVWREHLSLFLGAEFLPRVSDPTLLAFIVPLLSLPQVTHYILDGFIWKAPGKD